MRSSVPASASVAHRGIIACELPFAGVAWTYPGHDADYCGVPATLRLDGPQLPTPIRSGDVPDPGDGAVSTSDEIVNTNRM